MPEAVGGVCRASFASVLHASSALFVEDMLIHEFDAYGNNMHMVPDIYDTRQRSNNRYDTRIDTRYYRRYMK